MKKEKWNPEEWQGRTQQQVEDNHTAMAISLICLVVVSISVALYNILANL